MQKNAIKSKKLDITKPRNVCTLRDVMEKWKEHGHPVQRLRPHLGPPHPISRCRDSVPGSTPDARFLLMHTPRGHRWQLNVFEFLPCVWETLLAD